MLTISTPFISIPPLRSQKNSVLRKMFINCSSEITSPNRKVFFSLLEQGRCMMYDGTCFVAPGQEIGAIFLLPDAFFCLASTPSTNQIRVMTCIMTCQIDMIGQQCHVEWPRCIERDARFGAGLEGSFSSFGETSLVVLTLRCQRGNGGETAE